MRTARQPLLRQLEGLGCLRTLLRRRISCESAGERAGGRMSGWVGGGGGGRGEGCRVVVFRCSFVLNGEGQTNECPRNHFRHQQHQQPRHQQ